MNATGDAAKPIKPSFTVNEEGSSNVFVFVHIPELKVKRAFPNIFKFRPSNGKEEVVNFQNQAFTFTINVQKKLYSLAIARLPGEIRPDRCSIKYKRSGCWIKLIKSDLAPWMNKICDDFNPGLDIHDDDQPTPSPSAPMEEVQLKDTEMPPPYNLVPLAPSPSARPISKKAPAPPPPFTS